MTTDRISKQLDSIEDTLHELQAQVSIVHTKIVIVDEHQKILNGYNGTEGHRTRIAVLEKFRDDVKGQAKFIYGLIGTLFISVITGGVSFFLEKR